ncbi:hypothetical protein C882_4007 [Caenispirillum salinarum AK4]|uniref:Lipoprotein n=1 Tax=Caenispirillum salinarum AK4 TaxID=1238182 RepID=K9H3P0_9PROT|nr:hypothetical protein [Caenispirillum salinarum]EKV31634.1 hypothetical protein C882_4007 [Caenispirillum salinarum AK4]
MRALMIAAVATSTLALGACANDFETPDQPGRNTIATVHQQSVEGRDMTMTAAERAAAAAERAEQAARRAEQVVNRMEQAYQESLRK